MYKRVSFRSPNISFDICDGTGWPCGPAHPDHLQNIYCLSKPIVVDCAIADGTLSLSDESGLSHELWRFMAGLIDRDEPSIFDWFSTSAEMRSVLLEKYDKASAKPYLSEVRYPLFLDSLYESSTLMPLPGELGDGAIAMCKLVAPVGGPNQTPLATEISPKRIDELTPGFGLFSNPKRIADCWIERITSRHTQPDDLIAAVENMTLPMSTFHDGLHDREVDTIGPFLTKTALPEIPFMGNYFGFTVSVGAGFAAISIEDEAVLVGLTDRVTLSREEFFRYCDELVEMTTKKLDEVS